MELEHWRNLSCLFALLAMVASVFLSRMSYIIKKQAVDIFALKAKLKMQDITLQVSMRDRC